MGVPRQQYLKKIQTYLSTPEIIVLSGVRRSGKTTLMYQTINWLITEKHIDPKKILFVSLDTDVVLSLENPLETILNTFRKENGGADDIWLFLDEIQEIKDFARQLKSWYDSARYHIVISGSSSHLLETNTSTLLSGRYLPITVYPFSFTEFIGFLGLEVPSTRLEAEGKRFEYLNALRTYLRTGGFPALALQMDDTLRRDYLKAYYDSIIYRDIFSNHEIRNKVVMEGLYSYLLTNIATPQNYSSLAKQFSCDNLLVRDYIAYAEEGWLLYVVRFFSYSLKKQSLARKKIYAVDTGLRSAVSFVFSDDFGRLAENVVFLELKRRGYEVWYWERYNEVDFVLKRMDNSLMLINVCMSDNYSTLPPRETKGFSEFKEEFSGIPTESLILTDDFEGEVDGVCCMPLWKWLLGVC